MSQIPLDVEGPDRQAAHESELVRCCLGWGRAECTLSAPAIAPGTRQAGSYKIRHNQTPTLIYNSSQGDLAWLGK